MPLDLEAIRDRHEPYADTRVGQDIAALISEVSNLRSELIAVQVVRDILRERADHAEAILTGLLPGPVSDALLDARDHQSRTEGVSPAADWGRTVGRTQVVGAAQPVVEWTKWGDTDRATKGVFLLWVRSDGWKLKMGDKDTDSGPETGAEGRDKAEVAYRRACGFPTR